MSDLNELRRLLDEAPDLPWRYGERANADPYNGPDHTALEAVCSQEEGWCAIGEGGLDAFSGYGLALAAAAVNALPELLDAAEALERVRALHRPIGIWDECDCPDEAKDDHTHVEIEDVGNTCNKVAVACEECCTDGGFLTEDCSVYHHHTLDGPRCATAAIIEGTDHA